MVQHSCALAVMRKNSPWKEQCLTLKGGFVCLGEELELLPPLSSANKEKIELPGWQSKASPLPRKARRRCQEDRARA